MNSANENKQGSVSSNGEPAISRSTGKINIWFAPIRPLHFQIKHAMNTALQNYPVQPALFQIAALVEISTTPRIFESAPAVTASAFASLRLAAAKSKTTKNSPDANAADSSHSQGREIRTASPNNGMPRKRTSRSAIGLKKAEFHLIAPFAKSVKLAADFTEWEKFPLDLIKSEGGVWYTVVPLPPGQYSYRFIVDGRWCDDPHPARRRQRIPFGTANAVVEVT
jgi:hypothetical protein